MCDVATEVVGRVGKAKVDFHHRHLESLRCLDGKDFFGERLAEESLNVLVSLAENLDLLLNLVHMTHEVVNIDLAPCGSVLKQP